MQRLPDDSLTTALRMGGRDHFQWGLDRHLLASFYDAQNLNTKATGQWKKGKAPDFPAWPRPDTTSERGEKKRVSVKDIYAKFARR
ncbi:hypothetical protein RHODO2019_10905 [Rhodococcus antarcticus]|uniref:Uncharacterized protein n=1 Tax=Rhodococcus antarcticus TaxID=2987751 RepID=A0ABY6NWF6_9NOCA|nr:hypothetical protein [Rhodococcus antarcticus]UZJ23716.1 hypothetical protein RHODO2019_10905 [Rhodococcus antarcticus]